MYQCRCNFGAHIIGKTMKIIQASDVKCGDEIIWVQGDDIGYSSSAKVTKAKRKGDFVTLQFSKCGCNRPDLDHMGLEKFAHTALFGLIV